MAIHSAPDTNPFRALYQRAHDACIPINTTMELTHACNLRCLHCYNYDRSRSCANKPNHQEMPYKKMTSVISEVAAAGCLYFGMTGGEPLLHPRIYDLIAHARKEGLAISLLTNGSLLNASTVGQLADLHVFAIAISLYGSTAKVHEAITQTPGSFEKTIQGIRLCKEQGIRTKVKFMLFETNARHLAEMITLAKELDVPFVVDMQITSRYDGALEPKQMRVSKTTMAQLYQGPLLSFLKQKTPDPDCGVQCACGRIQCGISSSGQVYPCIGAPVPSGNLLEKSFKEIWEYSETLQRIRNLKLSDFADCAPCSHRPYCQRNSGSIYVSTGEYVGIEPFACQEAAILHEIHNETGCMI